MIRSPRTTIVAAGCLIALVLTAGAAGATSDGPPRAPEHFPGHTIVSVEGDAANGFTVHRLDGSSEHPPTLSESTAECEEYDRAIDVAVCIAEVETWFDGLADLRLSLRWAASERR